MDQRRYDRRFMETAVDEMLRSRSEHITRPDPLVGAAIADREGGFLGSTHRGRTRVGAHAEYTLIDRQLQEKDLEGSTVYVTLEPCTERGPGKTPCADRMIAARVSRVYVGMVDPNPAITGKGIAKLHEAGIDVAFFDADLRDKIREANKDFIDYCERLCEQDDEASLGESSPIENSTVVTAGVADLSELHISEYLGAKGSNLQYPSQSACELLASAGLLVDPEGAGEYHPSIAGLLLLGNDPASFLPQSSVLLEAQVGSGTIYDEASGALSEVISAIVHFLDRNMRRFVEIDGLKRKSLPEYPLSALREGIVNALAHRSYQEGARVHVVLSADSLVIRSPGLPVYPITLARLRAGDAVPFSRNPRISNALRLLNYMEERGSGISRMRELLASAGLGGPAYDFDSGYTVLTIHSRGQARKGVQLSDDQLERLSPNALRLLEHLQQSDRITARDCAEILEVSERYARMVLLELRDEGVVEKRGKAAKTHYVLV